MMLKRKMPWLIFLLLLTFVSCAKNDEKGGSGESYMFGFQINKVADEYDDFEIISILKDGGTLEEVYNDVDGMIVSDKLADVTNNNIDEFVNFSNILTDLLENQTDLITTLLDEKVKGIVELMIDKGPADKSTLYDYGTSKSYDDIDAFYDPSKETDYVNNFYAFLDELSDNNRAGAKTGIKESLRMNQKIIQYLLDKNEDDPNELREDIQELIDDLVDPDFEEDFLDITEFLGKSVIQADYPMWLDNDGKVVQRKDIDPDEDTNLDLGNPVKGMNIMLSWVNRMMADETNREYLNDVIREISKLFDPDDAEEYKNILKTLVYNLEDTLTEGGATYKSDDRYHQRDAEIESNAELGEGLREFFPALIQLNLRSDREAAMIEDNDWAKKVYPVHQMIKYLKNLQFDPDVDDIEKGLTSMLKLDFLGRDRTDKDSGAYPISFLEHTLFTVAIGGNFGYEDGGATGEITVPIGDVRKNHGHGKATGMLSLNDSLFSTIYRGTLNIGQYQLINLYEATLHSWDGDHISRSYKPFKRDQMDQKKFFYNANYGALYFLSSPGACDLGTPDGGQRTSGDDTMNSYKPYNPDGRGEYVPATWINMSLVRTTFNGEGPYYYADPAAKTVTVNGKTYYEYLRPNGKVYALVNKDTNTWEYIYPTDIGDAADDDTTVLTGYLTPTEKMKGIKGSKAQRFNRFKAEWNSDYYMFKTPGLLGNSYASPTTVNGNTTTKAISSNADAGYITFKELITENEVRRACASPLEAFYRNFVYYWFEKKFALVIPMYLSPDLLGLGEAGALHLGGIFIVVEGNGMTGLNECRKFKQNHVWAKSGKNGYSDIPGDYRLELAASFSTDAIDLGMIGGITEDLVYQEQFGKGHMTPGIISKNVNSIARLAFPKSPKVTRSATVEDYALGSLDFEATDDDPIWADRSAFIPIFISLLAGIYDNTPGYPDYKNPNDSKMNIKTGPEIFGEGLTPVLTPLMYYQKSQGQAPYNCWKPRIYGDDLQNYGNHLGNAYLQSTEEFYTTSNPLTSWNGSEEENLFFMPAPIKTFLNMLVDSDINDPAKRFDGILPQMITKTKAITAIAKMLLSDVNDTDELMQAQEQILTAMKSTKGEMTKILEGEATYGVGGSHKKLIFPDWMFVQGVESSKDAFGVYEDFTGARDEDTIFDDIVDGLVGKDALKYSDGKIKEEGYGLANYPDDKKTDGKPNLDHAEWKDFNDGYDDLVNLVFKDSQYSIVESIITVNESFFGNGHIYSADQIKGLLYTSGKLFTYYDKTKKNWVYQGEAGFDDLYTILTQSLPDLHDQIKDELQDDGTYKTNNYRDFLTINADSLKEDGLLDYVIDTVTVDYVTKPKTAETAEERAKWKDVFNDLDLFLNREFISEKDPLWSTTSDLLGDMADAIHDSNYESKLNEIYKDYGFQLN